MKVYYGLSRLTQLFEMIDDACEVMKGNGEDVEATKQLMLATAAQETHLGSLKDPTVYRAGAGVMQIDPIGIEDIKARSSAKKWIHFCREEFDFHLDKLDHRELNESPFLCVVAARVRYKVVPYKVPSDLEKQWLYYKKWYNSYAGAATREEYMKNYKWAKNLWDKWVTGETI